jgi:hypothetical protein
MQLLTLIYVATGIYQPEKSYIHRAEGEVNIAF